MPPPTNRPSCGVCDTKLVKNGTTSAGRTRWRCKTCGASSTQTRTDITRKAELTAFHSWLLNTGPMSKQALPASTFRRRTAWCWQVAPQVAPTGEVHRQILLDGTYFNGWCVLIAHTGTHVIDWQWCDREKTASWTALIERIPAPDYAIIDGNGPLRTVIKHLWPATRIQRCYFHIRQAGHKHLTQQPRLPMNRSLASLYRALPRVSDLNEAAAWTASFVSWEADWDHFLRHRTYAGGKAIRPGHVGVQQKWWYTHYRTRRARRLLAELIRRGEVFAWLDPEAGVDIVRSTSRLEGGPNKAIKDLLRAHRGMSIDHARRAVDWLLYGHTACPEDPWDFVEGEPWDPPRQPPKRSAEPLGPVGYDTGFSYEDGIGIRQGWGGGSR